MEISSGIQSGGFVGNIAPGWSVEESVAPKAPGEYSNGTGTVSFNAKSTSTTPLATNRETSTTITGLGTVTGAIKSASVNGIGASIAHSSKLADYDFDYVIPPLSAGSVRSAVDIVNQISGKPYFLTGLGADIDTYWSLCGHNAGFYFDEANDYKIRRGYSELVPYKYYSTTFADWITDWVVQNYGAIAGQGFTNSYNTQFLSASSVKGDNFRNVGEKLKFKGSDEFVFYFDAGPFYANYDSGYRVRIQYSTSTRRLSIDFTQHIGGVWTNTIFQSAGQANIYAGDEYVVNIVVNNSLSTTPFIGATIAPVNDPTNYIVVQYFASLTGEPPTYTNPWSISGSLVRALARKSSSSTLGYTHVEYEDFSSSVYSLSDYGIIGGPVPSVKTNAWTYLQDACAVYDAEISVINDELIVRSVGSRSVDITNIAVAPSLSVSSNYSGRSIDITYTNGVEVVNGEVYAAYVLNDDRTVKENNILEVKAGETVETTLQTNTSLSYVSGSIYQNVEAPTLGAYTVIDSSGYRLSETLWKNYGGSLKATINEDTPGAIDIKLHGPSIEIPAYPGPYKVAVSSGNEYAALSILGSGVKTDVKTLNLQTGADPNVVKQPTAKTINNPFINTLEQAYDAGIWASARAGEPTVTLSCSIPTGDIDGLGLVAGSVFTYGDSKYRVTSASINSIGVNLTAERYVNVSTFDVKWYGKTVGQHDALWGAYREQDQFIEPLKTV